MYSIQAVARNLLPSLIRFRTVAGGADTSAEGGGDDLAHSALRILRGVFEFYYKIVCNKLQMQIILQLW